MAAKKCTKNVVRVHSCCFANLNLFLFFCRSGYRRLRRCLSFLRSLCRSRLAPFYLQELISLKDACKYKLRSDCDGLLLNPVKFKTLTTSGDRSFAAAAPQLWNSFPYSIRSSRSVASFKKTLKTFLFQKAFF